jgi:hypothetical protein
MLLSKSMRFLFYSALYITISLGFVMFTLAQDIVPNSDRTVTTTTEFSAVYTNPYRITESHTTVGNRRIDIEQFDLLGSYGDYQPNQETETETVEVDARRTHIVTRRFTWDGNKKRNLAQVTEEQKEKSTSGESHEVRTTSNVDTNGKFQLVERQVIDGTNTSPNTYQLQTTTFLADGYGGLSPWLQTRESQIRGVDQSLKVRTETLQPDGNGKWKLREAKEATIREEGTIRNSDESVYSSDLDGKLAEVERTVEQERSADPKRSTSTETYSVDVPGYARDTRLHLIRRVTNFQQSNSAKEFIEEFDPNSGLRLTGKVTEVTQSDASGMSQEKTFQTRDSNGALNVIAVQARQTTEVQKNRAQ